MGSPDVGEVVVSAQRLHTGVPTSCRIDYLSPLANIDSTEEFPMKRSLRWLALGFFAGVFATNAGAVPAGSRSIPEDEFKDRAAFIPVRKYQPTKGKVVGVLVSNVQGFMANEGRGGPPDAMGFSTAGLSYRWIYVPVDANPL